MKRLQELKKILESNGAKEFLSIKIDPKDTELKESQEQQKSGNQTGGFLGGFGFHGHFGAPRKKMGRKYGHCAYMVVRFTDVIAQGARRRFWFCYRSIGI